MSSLLSLLSFKKDFPRKNQLDYLLKIVKTASRRGDSFEAGDFKYKGNKNYKGQNSVLELKLLGIPINTILILAVFLLFVYVVLHNQEYFISEIVSKIDFSTLGN